MIRYFHIVLLSLFLFIALSCAKIGSPFGGPKDETAPKVVKTKPPENSVNFKPEKKIIITFDEYIQLQDVFQEMIVSPPLEGHIMAQMQGKNLIVEFPEEAVFDSVTYTIDFGNSILDNNEGNILEAYKYIFSLKGYIDSMNVEGKIVNAFNHKPDEERMYVMLYKNLNDSAPYLEKPSYICRASALGNFSVHNIETGCYRLFALKDANYNFLFDLTNEQIAFSDSLIELTAERFRDDIIVDDTLNISPSIDKDPAPDDTIRNEIQALADTLNRSTNYTVRSSADNTVENDSTRADTLSEGEMYYSYYTELFFFTQEIRNQYMTNNLRPVKEQLFFSFNEALADTFELFPLNYVPPQSDWFLLDASDDKDTLKFWITDTFMLSMDTLRMEVCYPLYDSSGFIYQQIDTLLMMVPHEKGPRVRRERMRQQKEEIGEQKTEVSKINLTNNISNSGAFDLNKNIVLISPTPISKVFTERIKLFSIQDTLEIPVKIQTTRDHESYYRTLIRYEPEENTIYRVFIPDSTVLDIYGTTNDTTLIRFKTQTADYYGALTINLNGVKNPLLLQLLDENENLLIEKNIFSNESIRFDYLYPRNYFLKIVVDANGNGKWDTGNYLKKIQPEKVIYYPQQISIRSNWEMDFVWDLETEN